MGWMKDETGLDKCAANFVPLTPLSHLRRAVQIYPDYEALVYGETRRSYREYHARVTQLASALKNLGLRPGDVVATLLPNVPAHVEAHFGVPASGAVLNAINTRLEPDTISYIFGHGEAQLALVDTALLPLAEAAIARMKGKGPQIVEVADPQAGYPATGRYLEYEDFLASGDEDFNWIMPKDEWESLALNYTSGTTGRPKGIRRDLTRYDPGLVAGMLAGHLSRFDISPGGGHVHLCTSPMYHTAPLAFTWFSLNFDHAVVLMDRWDPERALQLIGRHRVTTTHMCQPSSTACSCSPRRCGRATTSRPCATCSTPRPPAPPP